jgi:hypothetical protein
MKKLAVLALLAIVGGGFYLIRDPGRVPLFDANLQRLAESEVEGYCAGVSFWQNQGAPNPETTRECRGTDDSAPALTKVQPGFCRGIREQGYGGSESDCMSILTGQKIWPTFDGGLTQAWSKNAPYPGDLVFVVPDDSRTGERDGFEREEGEQ